MKKILCTASVLTLVLNCSTGTFLVEALAQTPGSFGRTKVGGITVPCLIAKTGVCLPVPAASIVGQAPLATVDATDAGNITKRTLPSARLPAPTSATRGGVVSSSAPLHQFGTGIDSTGEPTYGRPAAGDVTDLAPSATIDATRADNITSGILPSPRLPTQTTTTPGGVLSSSAPLHKFGTSVDTSGVPIFAQPSASDVSGLSPSEPVDATKGENITLPPLSNAAPALVDRLGAMGDFGPSGFTARIKGAPPADIAASGKASDLKGPAPVPAALVPMPTSSTLGGVLSVSAPAHQFGTGVDATGKPTFGQPAVGDKDAAPSASIDTTDAGNISKGIVPAGRLPSAMGAFPAVGGFVPNIPGKVFAVRYLTDLSCASDQTANINAAIMAAGNGGEIEWPAGCILIATGVSTLPGQHWHGGGSGYGDSAQLGSADAPYGGTTFKFNKSSGVAIKLVGSGAKVSNVAVTDNVKDATAVAFQLGDDSGPKNVASGNPESQALDAVRIDGFGTQIDVQSGQLWSVTNFDLHDFKTYALRIRNLFNPDSGDGRLIGGTIYTSDPSNASSVAVQYESSGGFKMGFTKILNGLSAFRMQIADGAATGDLAIDRTNSFEGQNGSSVVLSRQGPANTGLFHNITIDPQIAGVKGAAIVVNPGVVSVRLGGQITAANFGIIISGGDGITLLPGTIMENIADTGLTIQDPATNVDASAPFVCFRGCPKKIGDNRATPGGLVNRSDAHAITLPSAASGGAFTNFYEVDLPAGYDGFATTLRVSGIQQGAGAVNILQANNLFTTSGSALSGPSTIASTSNGPGAVDVRYDTSTSGKLIVGLRSQGHIFNGRIEIDVKGASTGFKTLY